MQPQMGQFIGGLPENSMGGGQPQPAPQPQPQAFNPAQYMTPAPAPNQNDPGYGQFSNPVQTDAFGNPAQAGQPAQPQFPDYRQAQGQPAPYVPQMPQAQVPQPQGGQGEQPPAWAIELAQMMQQGQQPAQGGQQEPPRPKTWQEAESRIDEIVDSKIAARDQQEQQAKNAEETKVNEIMRDIDNQLTSMTQYGQIPAIANPSDPNDMGRSYRRELMGLANAVGSTNLTAVNASLRAAQAAGLHFDPSASNGQGAFVDRNGAPVAQGSFAPAQAPLPFYGTPPAGYSAPAGQYPPAYTPAGQGVPIAGGAPAASASPGGALPPIGQLRRASVGELMQGLTSDLAGYIG